MSTPKEIFLELLRPDGQPERQLRQYEALAMYLADPINVFLRGNRKRGTTSVDRWGVTIDFPEDAPGPIPVHTRGGRRPGPPPGRPPGTTAWSPALWAPASSSSATSSWILKTPSPLSMSTRTRCTS